LEKNFGAKLQMASRLLIRIGQTNSQLTPHYDFEIILPTSIKRQGDRIVVKNKFKAPDANIRLSDGSGKRLRDLWQSQTLVLVFLRHFG